MYRIIIFVGLFLWSTLGQSQTLMQMGNKHRLQIGASVKTNFEGGAAYIHTVLDHYHSITPSWEMKMPYLQPRRGVYEWSGADAIVNFAMQNGKTVHGHTLVFAKEDRVPSWFLNLSSREKEEEMVSFIKTTISHYKNKFPGVVTSWDVVNEAVDEEGLIRDSAYSDIGSNKGSFVALAFRAAAEADSRALLFYNDYDLSWNERKLSSVLNGISSLKRAGVKIDGLGIQGHFTTDHAPKSVGEYRSLIRRIASYGLVVKFTEVDVRIPKNKVSDGVHLQRAEDYYSRVYEACAREQACTGVTTWNVNTKNSWIHTYSPSYAPLLPFDDNFNKTRMFDAIADGLK